MSNSSQKWGLDENLLSSLKLVQVARSTDASKSNKMSSLKTIKVSRCEVSSDCSRIEHIWMLKWVLATAWKYFLLRFFFKANGQNIYELSTLILHAFNFLCLCFFIKRERESRIMFVDEFYLKFSPTTVSIFPLASASVSKARKKLQVQ